MNQVVIITENPRFAVERGPNCVIIREHMKVLRMGPRAAQWLVDTLYNALMHYTDEVFILKAPNGTVALAVFRDVEHIWIEGTKTRFAGTIERFRDILVALEHLHSESQ